MIQTAAEIGLELKAYLDATPVHLQDHQIVGTYVDRLTVTPGLFPEDALAFLAVAGRLIRHAAKTADEQLPEADRRQVLDLADKLTGRAIEVLERLTGYAADGFTAGLHQVH